MKEWLIKARDGIRSELALLFRGGWVWLIAFSCLFFVLSNPLASAHWLPAASGKIALACVGGALGLYISRKVQHLNLSKDYEDPSDRALAGLGQAIIIAATILALS